MRATLVPHPSTADGPIDSIEVQLERDGMVLWLRYVVEGGIREVVWPQPVAPERTDGLWRNTCFEAFVATDDGYVEYNLSPSGRWATYRFDSYRQGTRDADEVVENDGLNDQGGVIDLQARIALPGGAGRLALSTVIEDADGNISYWALAHPSDKPDFHHPDSFVLELP